MLQPPYYCYSLYNLLHCFPFQFYISSIAFITFSFRPYHLHAMHKCGLLVQMSHVAWSVCLCVGHTGELLKTAEPIEMPFGGLTHVGPRNHVLDGVQIPHGKGHFLGGHVTAHCNIPMHGECACPVHAAARITRLRCGLLPNYFGYLLLFVTNFLILLR